MRGGLGTGRMMNDKIDGIVAAFTVSKKGMQDLLGQQMVPTRERYGPLLVW